jgi:RNA polymerase sigma-32 factor
MKRKTTSGEKPAKKSAQSIKRKVHEPEILPAERPPHAAREKLSYKKAEDLDIEHDEEAEEVEDSAEENDQEAYASPDSQLPATAIDISSDIPDSEVRAVSPTDPLRRYLEEVRRYPLLDPEKEMELAIRLRDHGDLDAAKALVSANLRLVVKIAFEYRSFYANVLDLVQEGNIGLMKAVSKYDPTKGARLGYYASWWIRSYILKYLLDNFRLVKVGTTQAQKRLFYHLMREKERIEAQGLLAGPKLLAEKLNVREKDVVEMEQRLSGRGAEMSLDAPVEKDSGATTSHMDLLVDQHENADEQLAREELLQLLKKRLPEFENLLNDRERKLLHDRLLAEEPKTLQEVADLYGLTRERARQIEAKVISKLREFLAEDL